MARIPGSERKLTVLVNCKTYPSVSTKYIETVCTGGVQPTGEFVRLYPIPFRLLDERQQYKRWDIIEVDVYRDDRDLRPESWHFRGGSDIRIVKQIESEEERWAWLSKSVHSSEEEMEKKGLTNGLVEIEPVELFWERDDSEWTAAQMRVLMQQDLFIENETRRILAERVPWAFRLRYRVKGADKEFNRKVLAWSYYQGYRNNLNSGKDEQEALIAVKKKVESSILNPNKSVFAILGTHFQFKSWMVSAIYHVPKSIVKQGSLFG